MKFTREGVLTAIIVVVALFLGSRIVQLIPSADEQFGRPFEHHAAVGDAVEVRTGTIKVTGLSSATEVENFGSVAATTALWLVVDYEWKTVKEPRAYAVSLIELMAADGRTYGGLSPIATGCNPGQPHIKVLCQAIVEMPADALEGAVLHMPAGTGDERDDLVIVDLGIDAARAAELAQPEARIVLPGPVEKP